MDIAAEAEKRWNKRILLIHCHPDVQLVYKWRRCTTPWSFLGQHKEPARQTLNKESTYGMTEEDTVL